MSGFPALGVELVCNNGHPVCKFKKLKPWQGHVRDRACCVCARPIDRKDMRWRCNHHCDFDLCEGCYNHHWNKVIHYAVHTQDHAQRMALLEAVPESRRPRPNDRIFQAAQPGESPPAGSDYDPANKSGALPEGATPVNSMLAAGMALPMAITWALASVGYSHASTMLLSGDTPALPDPWILSAFSHLGGAVLCKAVSFLLRYDASQDKEAVDTMSSTVLGVLLGLESGIYARVLVNLEADAREDDYSLRPLVLAASGLLAGTNRPSARLALNSCLAVLSLLLSAGGGFDAQGFLESAPWLVVAGCITIFRWVFTLNVLPRHGGFGSLWCFAGQMLWPSGLVGFEVAFLTNYGSYKALLTTVPRTWQVAQLLLITAVLAGIQTITELKIVQAASLWTLALCVPLVQLVHLLLYGGRTAAMSVGILLYLAVLCVEAVVFWQDRPAARTAADDHYEKAPEGYTPQQIHGNASRSPAPWHGAQDARQGHGQLPPRPGMHPGMPQPSRR